MSSPSPPALQELYRLDRSSSGFHDQVNDLLHREEYKHTVPNLHRDDLVCLVDYLDGTLYREAVVWKRLAHPNIVPFLGITRTSLQLISEWMPGGGLTEYVKGNPDADRLCLLSDVADGLNYLHSCNVIHGDLKGPSILVDDAGHARITDFGLATVTENMDSVKSGLDDNTHTARWVAPEILYSDGSHSKEADIFSFAMVMIEAFTGAVPFNNMPAAAAMYAVAAGKRPPRPSHPTFTDELWALMERCWSYDQGLRPEASEVSKVLRGADPPAWKRLISHTLGTEERVSLITTIFSERGELDMVGNLRGEAAQAFVDVIDKELNSLASSSIRRRCLRYLYRICGHLALIPRSLEIKVHYNRGEYPLCDGGFADVWKCRYDGKEVAAKVLKVYSTSDFEQIRKRFCREVMTWRGLRHPNVLPLLGVMTTENRFVMISEWMANGSISGFVKGNEEADRLKLLRDVTMGLVYMHSQGIVHGDLKGDNILIDHNGRACLADFSLITVVSDRSTFLASCIEGGTTRWMSPELFDPDKFGLKESRPTKESDCYALGMVIYEVLSGRKPYGACKAPVVIRKVLAGERPGRPQGNEGKLFTASIWKVVQLCWRPRPGDRTTAETVLLGLKGDAISSDCNPFVVRSFDRLLVLLRNPTRRVMTADSSAFPLAPQTTHGENGLPGPPYDCPPSEKDRIISPEPAPPQNGGSKGGCVGWLARNARKTFKTVTGKFCEL